MRFARWLPLLALALSLSAASAQARPNPHLQRGIRLLNDMEDAKALGELQRALKLRGQSPEEKARVHLYLGIAQFNLLQAEKARASFRAALELQAAIELPEQTSPKIQQLFQRVRRELGGGTEPTTPSQPLTTPPPATSPASAPTPPPPRPISRVNWPAWLTLGLAGACGVAGLGLGLSSRSEASQADDLTLPYGAAKDHHDAATSRALAANILFGVAGAAAITSGILFWVGHRRAAAERPVATVVPLPSGAAVQISGALW